MVCKRLTQLERAATEAPTLKPKRDDPDLEILIRHNEEHEQHDFAPLRSEGLTIVEFADSISSINELYKIQEAILEAMRMGIDVIYQSTLFDKRWLGRPNIMRRVPVASDPDAFTYEIEDTKLTRELRLADLVGKSVLIANFTDKNCSVMFGRREQSRKGPRCRDPTPLLNPSSLQTAE